MGLECQANALNLYPVGPMIFSACLRSLMQNYRYSGLPVASDSDNSGLSQGGIRALYLLWGFPCISELGTAVDHSELLKSLKKRVIEANVLDRIPLGSCVIYGLERIRQKAEILQ